MLGTALTATFLQVFFAKNYRSIQYEQQLFSRKFIVCGPHPVGSYWRSPGQYATESRKTTVYCLWVPNCSPRLCSTNNHRLAGAVRPLDSSRCAMAGKNGGKLRKSWNGKNKTHVSKPVSAGWFIVGASTQLSVSLQRPRLPYLPLTPHRNGIIPLSAPLAPSPPPTAPASSSLAADALALRPCSAMSVSRGDGSRPSPDAGTEETFRFGSMEFPIAASACKTHSAKI